MLPIPAAIIETMGHSNL